MLFNLCYLAVLVLIVAAVFYFFRGGKSYVETPADTVQTAVGELYLPATESVDVNATNFSNLTSNYSRVVGFPEGKTPVAPEGFTVTKFAGDLISPRNIYVAPNGDVFVAEANKEAGGFFDKITGWLTGDDKSRRIGDSAKRITMFRDADKDGSYETRSIFLSNLNQPYGMLVIGNYFYVANTDGLWRYPYAGGETVMTAPGAKILELPAGGYNNHWTRNLVANRDNTKIYISVGSGSNVGENGAANEIRRANILEINPDGSSERIYASGLRNPVGMDWSAGTLWTAVNERDGLGDDVPPDYLTSVQDGGFYGWYDSYWGKHLDPRVKDRKPELVEKAIAPDVPLGSHTASLGLAFYNGTMFPEKYRGGAFVGQHGSWNREEFSGYKVVFVPFANGQPSGKLEDFLTGFVVGNGTKDVHGRPVGVIVMPDGSLLVADDAANVIWRVGKNK